MGALCDKKTWSFGPGFFGIKHNFYAIIYFNENSNNNAIPPDV